MSCVVCTSDWTARAICSAPLPVSCQQGLDAGGSAAEWLQLQKEKARKKHAVQRRAAEQYYNQPRAAAASEEVAKSGDPEVITGNLDDEVDYILEGYEEEMLKIDQQMAAAFDGESVMSSPEKQECAASPNKRDRISKCISLNIESFGANPEHQLRLQLPLLHVSLKNWVIHSGHLIGKRHLRCAHLCVKSKHRRSRHR